MTTSPEISDQQSRDLIFQKLAWMFRVRLVAALAVLLLFLTFKLTGLLSFPALSFSIICLIEAFINQPYHFIVSKIKRLDILSKFHLIFDCIIITFGIHFIGGIDGCYFNIVYTFPILFAGYVLSTKTSFLIAFFASVTYSNLIILEYSGIVSHIPVLNLNLDSNTQIVIVALSAGSFFSGNFIRGDGTPE